MGLLGVAREDLAPAGCTASRTSKTGLTTGATEYSQGFASVASVATSSDASDAEGVDHEPVQHVLGSDAEHLLPCLCRVSVSAGISSATRI